LSAVLLIISSLVAIAVSFVDPRWALWAFMLNFVGPIIQRWSPRPAAIR